MARTSAILSFQDLSHNLEFEKDPVTKLPAVQWALDICKKNSWHPICLVPRSKKALVSFLMGKTRLILLENNESVSASWVEATLKAQPLWTVKNVVFDPMARFNNRGLSSKMEVLFDRYHYVYGVYPEKNVSSSGFVDLPIVCEKPGEAISGHVWGLMGFKDKTGEELLKQYAQAGVEFEVERATSFVLKDFTKVVRNGKLQRY